MSETPNPKTDWSSGDSYEPYVGRWSRLVARAFLDWLAVPPDSKWLDVGCGTGALSQTILRYATPFTVKGIDRSDEYVQYAHAQTPDDRASFEVGDAKNLPVESGAYDAVVSGLMLNFVPDAALAVSEMKRAARSGGVVAVYLWDYADKMELMRHFWDAAGALDPAALNLDEGRRFPLCKPDPLKHLFRAAEMKDVEVQAIDVRTEFKDFDDYWQPFLGGQGPAPSYVTSLDESGRTALRERIRSTLPIESDGSISLIARAWAVRGKPI